MVSGLKIGVVLNRYEQTGSELTINTFQTALRKLEEQSSNGKIAEMSLAEIKTAIEQLSFEERAELAAWLHGSPRRVRPVADWKDDE